MQFEVRVVEQMRDIRARAGEEIVDARTSWPSASKPLAQVRAEESGAAGDQDARRRIINSRHAVRLW